MASCWYATLRLLIPGIFLEHFMSDGPQGTVFREMEIPNDFFHIFERRSSGFYTERDRPLGALL